jgi:hypothetical protein
MLQLHVAAEAAIDSSVSIAEETAAALAIVQLKHLRRLSRNWCPSRGRNGEFTVAAKAVEAFAKVPPPAAAAAAKTAEPAVKGPLAASAPSAASGMSLSDAFAVLGRRRKEGGGRAEEDQGVASFQQPNGRERRYVSCSSGGKAGFEPRSPGPSGALDPYVTRQVVEEDTGTETLMQIWQSLRT